MEQYPNQGLKFMSQSCSISDISQSHDIQLKCKALSSEERLDIIRLLNRSSLTVTEIASRMYMSKSTAMFHLRILEEAGFIRMALTPGKRGQAHICFLTCSSLLIYVRPMPDEPQASTVFTQEIPVGHYTAASLDFPSGFCTDGEQIMFDDMNFFRPRRMEAQLLWGKSGFVEYTLCNIHKGRRIVSFRLSLEICSETMSYRNGWQSDITFWLNGHEILTYTSPCDFGGRRGKLNPDWWPDNSTQYGELKQLILTCDGVFLNGVPVSQSKNTGLLLNTLPNEDRFIIRIGNKPDAPHVGGFNLFGCNFGDYPQDIRVEVEYGDG